MAKCAYGLGWMEFKNKCYIKSSAMASWYAAKVGVKAHLFATKVAISLARNVTTS